MTTPSSSCSLLLLLLTTALALIQDAVVPVLCQPPEDLVVGLPGQPAVGFRHYAGYVRTRPDEEKALFYWFFEADGGGSSTKPLVLWLNGGPGCSSIAYGAALELGPFLVRSSGPNLTYNPYSWNKVANLLFLEAPVGVGFSYTNRSSDLRHLGDHVTAKDSYSFLLNWFDRFPAFRSHEFYISGESYAGHYVPQLSDLIYEGNKAAGNGSRINFKGFMIGNAVINDGTDQLGMVEYAWSHAIISDDLYHRIKGSCGDFTGSRSSDSACSSSLNSFLAAYEDIDIYSIYAPVCLSHVGARTDYYKSKKLVGAPLLFLFHRPEVWDDDDHGRLLQMARAGYDPCTTEYVDAYFNRADVQKALHANTTKLSYSYSPCSNVIEKWNDSPATELPTIRKLMKAGIRVWIYSGDTDGRVPVTSTRNSLRKMGLKTEKEWRAWYNRRQVAGWVVEYEDGLTFATVRGAGHQVPVLAPDSSLSLLQHFLAGKPLPSKRI